LLPIPPPFLHVLGFILQQKERDFTFQAKSPKNLSDISLGCIRNKFFRLTCGTLAAVDSQMSGGLSLRILLAIAFAASSFLAVEHNHFHEERQSIHIEAAGNEFQPDCGSIHKLLAETGYYDWVSQIFLILAIVALFLSLLTQFISSIIFYRNARAPPLFPPMKC